MFMGHTEKKKTKIPDHPEDIWAINSKRINKLSHVIQYTDRIEILPRFKISEPLKILNCKLY